MKKIFLSLSAMLLLFSCSDEVNELEDLNQIEKKNEFLKFENIPETTSLPNEKRSAKKVGEWGLGSTVLLEYYDAKLQGNIRITATAGVSEHVGDLGIRKTHRVFSSLKATLSGRSIDLNLKKTPGFYTFKRSNGDRPKIEVPTISNTRNQSSPQKRQIFRPDDQERGYTEYYKLKPSDIILKVKPLITDVSSGCNDLKCIWITGQFNRNFSTRVELRKAYGNREIVGIYRAGEFDFNNNESITLRLKSDNELNEFRNNGLRVYVINEYLGTWSSYADNRVSYGESPPIPIITNSGSGCDDKKCIWIESKNYEISDSMRVEIRNGSTWEIISRYRGNDLNYTNFGITLRLKTNNEVNIFQNNGLRIFLVNERYGTFSSYGGNHISRR